VSFDRIWRGLDYAPISTAPVQGENAVTTRIPFETAVALAIQASAAGNPPAVAIITHLQGKEGPMAKMMTKSQIAGHLANKFELTKKQSVLILEELATLAARQAKNGFVFPGVGKLVVVRRKARMGRNPQTGEPIKIPAKTVLKFRIAKAMKELALK
jgi:DNA-binding protein HU-beta